MVYCRKFGRKVTGTECLGCDECLPPSERLGGELCVYEDMDAEPLTKGWEKEMSLEEYARRKFPRLENMNFGYDQNEDLRNSFIDGGNFILHKLPTWEKGTPPQKGWWLTKTTHEDGHVTIACETFKDDKWPYEGNDNVMYMDMNDLKYLP